MALQVKDFSLTAKSGHGKITYTYTIRVTEESTDPVKNCSSVKVEAILKQTYSGTAFSGYRTGVSCDINGQNLFSDYCRRTIAGREEHVFYAWNGEMPHEADGKLTLHITGKLWQTKAADYTPPTMQIPEGVMELTPIPRASQVGAADTAIGGRCTLVITPADPSFTHTLGYAFGKQTGYICQDGSVSTVPVMLTGTTVSFLIPESFYAQILDKPAENCTVTCTTYSGETPIGVSESVFRISTEADRCAPTGSCSAVDSEVKTLALTGNEHVLIRYMSRLQVTLEARGRYGASITGKRVNGIQLEGDVLEIPNVESAVVSAIAEDSRGHQTVFEKTLEMIPYVLLTNNASVARTSPTDGQARLVFSGNCYRGSLGTAENNLVLRYRLCPEFGQYGDWQELTAQSDEDHTYRLEVLLSDLDYTKSYTLQTQAADALDTAETVLTVMPGVPVYHWKKDRFYFHVPVECDSSIGGAYIRTHTLFGDSLMLTMEPGQTVLLAGANGAVCGIAGSGGSWWGSDSVAAQADGEQVRLTVSPGCAGELLLISARPVYVK